MWNVYFCVYCAAVFRVFGVAILSVKPTVLCILPGVRVLGVEHIICEVYSFIDRDLG